MKREITEFINGLIKYDYALFISVFVLFILFIIIGILLRNKRTLSIFCVFIAFSIFMFGPTIGYVQMHKYLFKNEVTISSQKKLTFTKAIVVKGILSNESSRDFKSCKITASVYKVTSNKYKNYIHEFKPFQKMSILEKDIAISEKRNYKMFIEPFVYERDYNISIGADCK